MKQECTTTENDTLTRTPCPSWCDHHPSNEPEAHQAARWTGYGLTVGFSTTADYGTGVYVDHGPRESLTLTEDQAHELGLQLVRTADRIRRARQEGQR